MGDEYEGLSDDELDRGLGAAFRKATTADDRDSDEQVTQLAPDGVMESIRAAHGVAATVDLGDEDGAAEGQGAIRTPRYDVGGEIARGGMGAIYRVRDRDLRRSLAMKVLIGGRRRPGGPVDPEYLNRFLEEAQVTAQLAHPGVVPVHELGVDANGRIFFTMNLVRGKTLSEIIQLARRREGGWTRTRALQVILRVCETLAYAHDRGVIHRDVKPDNVMVGRFGETYLMDWGLAKVMDRVDLHDLRLRDLDGANLTVIETKRDEAVGGRDSPIVTMDGAVVGTPAYMPPEQARGAAAELDERADVYAVGALLYELLTGHPPYIEPETKVSPRVVLGAVHMGPPKPIREIDDHLPDEIVAICEKAMSREPDDRYAGALELAEDIQAFIEGRVVQAYRTGPVVELRKWVGRNRPLAASLTAAVLIAILGSVGFAIHARGAAEKIGKERDKVEEEKRKVAVERDREAAARRRAEGLRLSARAGNEGIRYPGTALGLAIEGAERADDVYGRTALYRALANLHEIATLEGHETYVTDVAFDEHATHAVSVSEVNGEVIVWDLREKVPIRRAVVPPGAAAGSRGVAIARFGRLVAVAGKDGWVRIADPAAGRYVQAVELGSMVPSMSWDAAGERIAVVSEAGRVRVWRPPAEAPDLAIDAPPGAPGAWAVALRGDGSQVAVQDPSGRVAIHDVSTGALVREIPSHADGPELTAVEARLAWLDGGHLLLSWRAAGGRKRPARAEIWDAAVGTRVAVFGAPGPVCLPPVWNATGTTVAFSLHDPATGPGHTVVWDAAARGHRTRLPAARLAYRFSPGGRFLVTNDQPHNLGRAYEVWDVDAGEVRAALRGHTYHLRDAAITDDGLVVTASNDTTVRLWSVTSALVLPETAHLDGQVVTGLYAGFRRAIVRPADGSAFECRTVPDDRTLHRFPPGLRQVAIDHTRDRLAYADPETGRIHVVDGLDGRPLCDWQGPDSRIWLRFSPDGRRLAGWAESRLWVFDPDDGTVEAEIDPGLGPGVGWTWAPESGSVVLYERATRQLMEVEVPSGAVVRRFDDGHTGWITSAAVSPSGELVATGAADRSVILWDRATGKQLHRFTGLFMTDLGVDFDPSGRFIVVRAASDAMTLLDTERRETYAEVPVPSLGVVQFDAGDVVVGDEIGKHVLRLPLDPLAAARRLRPGPMTPMQLDVYDVGSPQERAELDDTYAAWTFAPHRILPIGLRAVADEQPARAERHLARIEKVAPGCHERFVLRAALHLDRGDTAAALEALERAVDAGCSARTLRHRVFDTLRDTAGWKTLRDALDR